jgi:hypothetical protein
MSDFLHRLAARALGTGPVVQPIVPTMFAPDGGLEQTEARPDRPARDPAPPIETVAPAPAGVVRHATLPEPAESFRPERTRPVEAVPLNDPGPVRETLVAAVHEGPVGETLVVAAADVPSAGLAMRLELPSRRSDENPSPGSTATTVRDQPDPDPAPRAGSILGFEEHPLDRANVSSLARDFREIPPAAPRREAGQPAAGVAARERPLATPLPRGFERARVEAQPPVVRVTIGRIDVRADFPAPVSHNATPRQPRSAARSLDDYLKERIEGKR